MKLKVLLLDGLQGSTSRVWRLTDQLQTTPVGGELDAIIVNGGLAAKGEYDQIRAVASAEGDAMALIARLESVVCRVLYVPSADDPPTMRSSVVPPPALSQHSVNLYNKMDQLTPDILVMGFQYCSSRLAKGENPFENTENKLILVFAADSDTLGTHPSNVYLIRSGKQEIASYGVDAQILYTSPLEDDQFVILTFEQEQGRWQLGAWEHHHLRKENE